MNKSFLSKKSWHTSSFRNVETVWRAEQKATEEKKKIEEWKRDIEQQDAVLELRKMKQEAGGTYKERLDWMYEGDIKSEPTPEDFLTKGLEKGDNNEDFMKQLQNAPGSNFLSSVNTEIDEQMKVVEDPLLEIKRREQMALQQLVNNPVQMNKLKKDREARQLIKNLKKLKKKQEKKKLKKAYKESKRKSKIDKGETLSSHHSSKKSSNSREDRRSPPHSRPRSPPRSYRSTNSSSSSHRSSDYSKSRSNRKPQLSQREKEEKLKEMMQDAEVHEENRWNRINNYKEREDKEDKKHGNSASSNPEFLKQLNKGVYDNDKASLSDRVQRNINNIQRNSE